MYLITFKFSRQEDVSGAETTAAVSNQHLAPALEQLVNYAKRAEMQIELLTVAKLDERIPESLLESLGLIDIDSLGANANG